MILGYAISFSCSSSIEVPVWLFSLRLAICCLKISCRMNSYCKSSKPQFVIMTSDLNDVKVYSRFSSIFTMIGYFVFSTLASWFLVIFQCSRYKVVVETPINVMDYYPIQASEGCILDAQKNWFRPLLVAYRVMTVSFHKFGDNFFPGTGDMKVRDSSVCTSTKHIVKSYTTHAISFSSFIFTT